MYSVLMFMSAFVAWRVIQFAQDMPVILASSSSIVTTDYDRCRCGALVAGIAVFVARASACPHPHPHPYSLFPVRVLVPSPISPFQMPTKKGAAALKRAAVEAEKGEGDDVVHAENAATSNGKHKAAKRGKRSKSDTGGEDMQSLKKKKVEGKGENNDKGKSKENLDHLDNVEGLTSSDATSRGTKKNCPKPKRDKIESQNPAEMLARLNIRVNDACDNACNTAGQARRAVFLFAHGAGGISPVFLCDANFSCIFMRKANSFCLVESPHF